MSRRHASEEEALEVEDMQVSRRNLPVVYTVTAGSVGSTEGFSKCWVWLGARVQTPVVDYKLPAACERRLAQVCQ